MARIYQNFKRNEAGIIQDSYCCAGCWNRIICGHDPQGDFMDCGTPDCNLPGLVSSQWVEHRLQKSAIEWAETKQVLAQAVEWMNFMNKKIGISREKSLEDLGF